MYTGALKFSHPHFNVYVARVAPLGFFYTCLRSALALLDVQNLLSQRYGEVRQALTNAGADESLFRSRHSAAITTSIIKRFSIILLCIFN